MNTTQSTVSQNIDPAKLYQYYVKDCLYNQLQTQKKHFKDLMTITCYITGGILLFGTLAYLFANKVCADTDPTSSIFVFLLFDIILFGMVFLTSGWSALHDVTKTERMLQALQTQTFTYKIYHDVHIISYGNSCVAHCKSGESYRISPHYSGYPDTDLLVVELCGEILVYVLEPILN